VLYMLGALATAVDAVMGFPLELKVTL